MSEKSSIEWTDSTWNPIRARNRATGKIGWHCEHVTPGCANCYAEGFNKRLGTGLPFKPGHRKDIELFLDEKMLLAPLSWKKPRLIFMLSMTDLFGPFVTDEMIDRIFAVMALAPQHTFQVLTKRAERMRKYCGKWGAQADFPHVGLGYSGPRLTPAWPLPNVWLGISAEDHERWDERKEHLRATPAAIRFASFEPLLGPIAEPRPLSEFINWAIGGGESGPNARPMHPNWARSLRDQCSAARVAYFFKQWGEWAPHKVKPGGDLGGDVRRGVVRIVHPTGQTDVEVCEATGGRNTIPGSRYMARVGKKAAGRLLDGIEHNGMPEVSA